MAGGKCTWPSDKCPVDFHKRHRGAGHVSAFRQQAEPQVDEDNAPESLEPPPALEQHDVRQLSWWLVEQVIRGKLEERRAGVVATMVRILVSLGPEPLAPGAALEAIRLRASLMHGIPPKEDEWPAIEAMFDDQAVEEIRRWSSLFERDVRDHDEPLVLGNVVAGDGDVASLIHDEDRVG